MSTAEPLSAAADALRSRVDARLEEIARFEGVPASLREAMQYLLLAPAKRIRPTLTILACEACGGSADAALDPACAVEMVHTCSLILDDLPSMDDAELRRGRSSTHRVFGSDLATLAAFSLLNAAFARLTELPGVSADRRVKLVQRLSRAIGHHGVVAGQVEDLHLPHTGSAGADDLMRLAERKTGALFAVSAEFGAEIAGASLTRLDAIRSYADHLGLAFQILDDLLDHSASAAAIGKDVGQDEGRANFVSVWGDAQTRTAVQSYADRAVDALVAFGSEADGLRELAALLRTRATASPSP